MHFTLGLFFTQCQRTCSFLSLSVFPPMHSSIAAQAQPANIAVAYTPSLHSTTCISASTMCIFAGSVQTRSLQMTSTQGNPADFFQHPTPLGSNLYDRDRARAAPPKDRQIGFGGQPNLLPTTSTPAEPETPEKVCEKEKEE